MTRLLLVLSLVPANVLAAPTALASSCESGPDAPVYATQQGASVTVWSESNGRPGLQTHACEDESGRPVPADTQVGRVPPSLPPIPMCVGNVCIL